MGHVVTEPSAGREARDGTFALLWRRPAAPLSHWIESLWISGPDAPPHEADRILPTGACDLVINRERSVVSGPHSTFAIVETREQASAVGAHLTPVGAFVLFGMPVSELVNLHVPLDKLFGRGHEIRERVLEAAAPIAKLQCLERMLAEHLTMKAPHPAVGYAARTFCRMAGMATVAQVTREVGLSSRRFIQLFTREVGLTPKVFCRVKRFQRVVALVHGCPEIDWTAVAAQCGYHDQSHLIHDFRAFSGLTPSAYLMARSTFPNHLPLGR